MFQINAVDGEIKICCDNFEMNISFCSCKESDITSEDWFQLVKGDYQLYFYSSHRSEVDNDKIERKGEKIKFLVYDSLGSTMKYSIPFERCKDAILDFANNFDKYYFESQNIFQPNIIYVGTPIQSSFGDNVIHGVKTHL